MKIVNRAKVEQIFGGVTIAPGETWEDGKTVEPSPKRGRPRKEK
jgi:hypothetical protein